jgi:uncharacterized protein YbaR (Trm112 family)
VRVRYRDAAIAVAAWREGANVMGALRDREGLQDNTPEIIELAYDLQAGSYVRTHDERAGAVARVAAEYAAVLGPLLREGDRVLDVGAGELTTLASVAAALPPGRREWYGCDLSWSRLHVGRRFVAERPAYAAALGQLACFTAEAARLPVAGAGADVVTTFHALEPNRGREAELVAELVRAAARWVVMFEPSYEHAGAEDRARMDALGYVRDLPGAIGKAGAELVAAKVIEHPMNPRNPTVAFIVRPPHAGTRAAGELWSCPVTRTPLRRVDHPEGGWLRSDESFLLYPVVGGIPLLTTAAAVFASQSG